MYQPEMPLEIAARAGGAAARTRQRLDALSADSAARQAWSHLKALNPPVTLRESAAERLTYWSYIEVEAVLALGKPRSPVPDERVFIVFHQIVELLFSLIIHELEQIAVAGVGRAPILKAKLPRVILHFDLAVRMTGALARVIERESFLAFRNALAPASAFQSFQYRKIELLCGRLHDLIPAEQRARLAHENRTHVLFEHLYWRKALGPRQPGERTTLSDFEQRYLKDLRRVAADHRGRTLAELFRALPPAQRDSDLVRLLRQLDRVANEVWPHVHFQLAKTFLPADQAGTGGTQWQKYLSTSRASIRFFPELHVRAHV